jgi:hypothetical protein
MGATQPAEDPILPHPWNPVNDCPLDGAARHLACGCSLPGVLAAGVRGSAQAELAPRGWQVFPSSPR